MQNGVSHAGSPFVLCLLHLLQPQHIPREERVTRLNHELGEVLGCVSEMHSDVSIPILFDHTLDCPCFDGSLFGFLIHQLDR